MARDLALIAFGIALALSFAPLAWSVVRRREWMARDSDGKFRKVRLIRCL